MFRYWGKADKDGKYHLLVYHCLDVAAVGKVWLEKSPAFVKRAATASGLSENAFVEWFLFFLALHDLGKFDVRFQNLRKDLLWNLQKKKCNLSYSPRHDQRGFEYWTEEIEPYICSMFSDSKYESDILREWFSVISAVVTGHHGIPPCNTLISKFRKADIEAVKLFVLSIFKLLVSPSSCLSLKKLSLNEGVLFDEIENQLKNISWQLAGLTTLCDWIASGDEEFTFISEEIKLSKYFESSCKKATNALVRAEIVPASISNQSGMKHLFPQFTKPTPLQTYRYFLF